MKQLLDYVRELCQSTVAGWNRFWFTPTDAATLGLIRILAGSMLFYTHLVWSLDLEGFFGSHGRISPEFVDGFHRTAWAWSHFNWIGSPITMWCFHVLALASMAMLTVGLFSRTNSVLTFLFTVSYVHRVPGALFGLDQINAMLAMYLMVGPCGAAYSVDRLLAARRGSIEPPPSVSTNMAIRLVQLHLCVIYVFSGAGKLLGASWWDGTAMWGALANYEYQTFDMTWLGRWPLFINLLTHIVLLWEITYFVLVWPRLTRPLVLALAVPLHLGIAICMGMITFGSAMLIGNLAFVSPRLVRQIVAKSWSLGRAGGRAPDHAAAVAGNRMRPKLRDGAK